MTSPFASRVWQPVRILPFLLPVSAAIAQTDPSGLQWLQRIYAATEKLSYSGTFVYQQGQQFETSRITHVVEASVPRERLETLDGVPREIIRTGDEVVCYLPASLTVKIDKQPGRRPFPAILSEQLKDVSENYTIRKGEIERVGGYSCQVLALEPKDRMRYGHRLWADLNSGMLLKAKTFDEKNQMVEQFAFTQLKIGGHIGRDQLKARYFHESRMDDPFQACGISHCGRADSHHGRHRRCRPYRAVRRDCSDLGIHRARGEQAAGAAAGSGAAGAGQRLYASGGQLLGYGGRRSTYRKRKIHRRCGGIPQVNPGKSIVESVRLP